MLGHPGIRLSGSRRHACAQSATPWCPPLVRAYVPGSWRDLLGVGVPVAGFAGDLNQVAARVTVFRAPAASVHDGADPVKPFQR